MQFAHFEFDPVVDRLGEGPLSEVYRAVDRELGRTVALKILRAHAEIDPAADDRFRREAKHTSNLVHPNIATIYEYGKDQGTSYIAMEYLEGRTLDKIIKDQLLGYEEGVRIALQVSDALALVHRSGLIHRDLKPGNIMLQHDGAVKLLDFGIARASNEAAITQHGVLVGTVLYMSPEQVRGDELDIRSDVFALGSVMYHALTRELPFPGKSFPEVCMAILDGKPRRPSQVRLGFPPALEEFVMKCLEPQPADRWRDAGAAHGALLSIADGSAPVNGAASASQISGSLLIAPIRCVGNAPAQCAVMAGSLRRDLGKALHRTKDLRVKLIDGQDPPAGERFDYVLRGELDVRGADGKLELYLERYAAPPTPGAAPVRREMLKDRIEFQEANEFALEEGLVRGALKTVKKRLSEISLRPEHALTRRIAEGERHALHAHAILHRGTTKHLVAAISSFRRALEADHFCALAHAGLAEALVRKYLYFDGEDQFLAEAREHAARALAIDPECAEAHTSLGFAWHMSGHATDAQREYRLAMQIDKDEWLAHRLLGAVLARAGNFRDASPLLRRAIALKPWHIGSYDHLYNVLHRLDRYEEALQVADQGIGAARAHLRELPDNQEARLHMAMLLARLGQSDEARAEVARARQIAPKDGYTSYHAANVLALIGDLDEAVEQLGQAQARGYFIQSELSRNTDLDVLRGLPEFQQLVA